MHEITPQVEVRECEEVVRPRSRHPLLWLRLHRPATPIALWALIFGRRLTRTCAVLTRASFGPGFKHGGATSSYQLERAVNEEGRGPSICARFAHTAGKVKQGHHGDVACDHYRRMPEDVKLLAWLGVDVYRFSIAWPRIFPEGR